MKQTDRDHTLLFAWRGEVVGEGVANIAQSKDPSYGMDFVVHDYRAVDAPVSLKDLVGRKKWRDLLVLNQSILDTYRKKAYQHRKH